MATERKSLRQGSLRAMLEDCTLAWRLETQQEVFCFARQETHTLPTSTLCVVLPIVRLKTAEQILLHTVAQCKTMLVKGRLQDVGVLLKEVLDDLDIGRRTPW